jgi:adenosylmethionine-8-amino-7-oxononanoate aminotransferase
MPLAVTLCTRAIFDAHVSTDPRRTFFHSSSYTANPIACAAAVANLEVWETEPVMERIAALATAQAARLESFRDDARFSGVRQIGTITALDVDSATTGYLSEAGPRLRQEFQRSDILLRPLGNTIYVMPPYCVTGQDLDLVYDAISRAARTLESA